MIKQYALRLLGVGLLGVCWAGSVPVAKAEPGSQDPGGIAAAAPTRPATTGAIPASDPPKDARPDASVPPKEPAPAATAAVAPPSGEKPASTSASPNPPSAPADAKPETAPNTNTAIVTPPATSDQPAASPAPAAQPPASPSGSDSKAAPGAAAAAPAAHAAAPADAAAQSKPAETPTPVVTAPAGPPPPPPVNPIVEAARAKLADKSFAARNTSDDMNAARDFYSTRTEPLWVKGGEFTHKAKEVINTLKAADDWGLDSSDFVIPRIESGAAGEGAAEAQLTLSALKYARFARGGRLDPVSLSNILDMRPPVKEGKVAMRELASASEPGAYLRGLNPKHVGFERLRQALLKARGGEVRDEAPVDPALLVKLPSGKTLKKGTKDEQVSLLRQRLRVPADDPADDLIFDDRVADAVRNFQQENGLKANGVVTNRVRQAMNDAGKPKKARSSPSENVDRLIANMERWRWLPTDLGKFYVMNNIPEFTSEIWKDDRIELKQKIIVGQPAWPTPLLAAKMEFVIFHPSWGMPDGIKAKELAPRLRQASSSGFGFFDQLFGGGSSGADIIAAYKLQVYYNGQRVDPNSINWRTADLRQYSFIQPPGGDNPLGLVKFRFPNRHDVYMHDTPERNLFSQSSRALSHGCMRVEQPRRTAEVILAQDKGYSPEKVGELWDSGASVTLSKEVPVYLVYFTAKGADDGQIDTYSDIYGIDSRVMSALRGQPVRFIAQEAVDPTEAAEPGGSRTSSGPSYDAGRDDLNDDPPPARTNRTTAKKQPKKEKLQDALSNIFLN